MRSYQKIINIIRKEATDIKMIINRILKIKDKINEFYA